MGLSKRNQTPIEPMVNQMVLLEIKGRVIRHPLIYEFNKGTILSVKVIEIKEETQESSNTAS